MDSDYHRPQGYRWPRLWDEALRQRSLPGD